MPPIAWPSYHVLWKTFSLKVGEGQWLCVKTWSYFVSVKKGRYVRDKNFLWRHTCTCEHLHLRFCGTRIIRRRSIHLVLQRQLITWESNPMFDCNENVFRQSKGVQGGDKLKTRWGYRGDDDGIPVFLMWFLVGCYVGPTQGSTLKVGVATYCETLVRMHLSVRRHITKCCNLKCQNIKKCAPRLV